MELNLKFDSLKNIPHLYFKKVVVFYGDFRIMSTTMDVESFHYQ